MAPINSFPGYEYVYNSEDQQFHNMYRGTDVGKGGYVYAEPGIYGNVALLDVASMHPSSMIALNYFGEYTSRFKELMDIRIAIKHKDYESARRMFDGRLTKYLEDETKAKALSKALKLPINMSYGMTAANFENPMRDVRNKNNIVALRGALFMRTLQDEVQKRGFKVAHIKTDSIKIPDATPEIIDFVMEFGKKYDYTFEHEATYDRMCLVNNAVYIAKYATKERCEELYGYAPGENIECGGDWTATGAQFAVPYVFKTLFTKEPIKFDDLCETKSVKTGDIYLDMNEHLSDVTDYEKELKKTEDKYKKGQLSDIMFESICADLTDKIANGHDYHFVGRVGRFCPIQPGKGGGLLVVNRGNKYDSVSGAKDYRWLESELIQGSSEDIIDRSYYDNLVTDAVHTICAYGDFEWLISDDPYVGPQFVPGEEMAWPDYGEKCPFPDDIMNSFGLTMKPNN